jgi:hypothetical protein
MSTKSPEQRYFVLGAVFCIAIPGIVVALRIYTKLTIIRKWDAADVCIALGFPFLIVLAVMGHYMVKYGAGAHQWNITRAELFDLLYWGNVAEITYFPAIFLVKMSILLQYLRMFAPNRSLNKTMFYGAWTIIIASFLSYGASMFWTIWYCKPRQMIWNKLTPGGHCHDHGPIVFSSGIYNVFSDICILLLPVLSLWRLRIPVGRKIAVSMLFATGLLACIASVMRIVFTIRIAPPIYISDVSYNAIWIGLWSEAEISLGYIVACTLSLPKLMRAHRVNLSRVLSPFRSSQATKSSGWTMSTSADQNMGLAQSRQVEEDIVLEEVVGKEVTVLSPVMPEPLHVHVSQFPATPPEFDAPGLDHIQSAPYPSPQRVQYARVYEHPATFYDHSP